MKITVTREHVERGIHCEPRHCPLAIAINEQCPAYEASVGVVDMTLFSLADENRFVTIPLPLNASEFVMDFDFRGKSVIGKRTWRFWRKPKTEYVFDIAIPESRVTKSVNAPSVPKLHEVR